ncbi:hypothetical protein [Streptomyces varsoviensis]|uniref:hypothetical protein n=1 Tax=Streptomyces varsoviensis TaxID=67373 RepID=UPI000A460FAB|nr:hypothetical protein [Streptomyces varsoviensis]
MPRKKTFPIASATLAVLAAASLQGCTSEHKASSLKFPDSVCWDAFNGADVKKLVPDGKKFSSDTTNNFDLYNGKESTICSIYIDGRTRFLASAHRYPVKNSVEQRNLVENKPNIAAIKVGDKGWVWDTGAASTFACNRSDSHPATDPQHPNSEKYVILRIDTYPPAGKKSSHQLLEKTLRHYTDFAVKKLLCRN